MNDAQATFEAAEKELELFYQGLEELNLSNLAPDSVIEWIRLQRKQNLLLQSMYLEDCFDKYAVGSHKSASDRSWGTPIRQSRSETFQRKDIRLVWLD
jgi:hypothetical protein